MIPEKKILVLAANTQHDAEQWLVARWKAPANWDVIHSFYVPALTPEVNPPGSTFFQVVADYVIANNIAIVTFGRPSGVGVWEPATKQIADYGGLIVANFAQNATVRVNNFRFNEGVACGSGDYAPVYTYGPGMEFLDFVGVDYAPQSYVGIGFACKLAHIWENNPTFNNWDVRRMARLLARNYNTGWNERTGYGRLLPEVAGGFALPLTPEQYQAAVSGKDSFVNAQIHAEPPVSIVATKADDAASVAFQWSNFRSTHWIRTEIWDHTDRIIYSGTDESFVWASDIVGNATFRFRSVALYQGSEEISVVDSPSTVTVYGLSLPVIALDPVPIEALMSPVESALSEVEIQTELMREITRMEPSALIELFTLDATDLGGSLFNFVSATNYDGLSQRPTAIVFGGETYAPLPIEVKGFGTKSKGELPRPTIRFANLGGLFTGLALAFDDLTGAKLIRTRTFAKFLDGAPEASPTSFFPRDVFYVDRKVSENKSVIEFELGTLLDVDGEQLPRRQVTSNLCHWPYRGTYCGFADNRFVADRNNNVWPTSLSVIYRGTYSNTRLYVLGDAVSHVVDGVEGIYRLSLTTSVGEAPSSTRTSWLRMQRFRGLWNKDTLYYASDVVYLQGKDAKQMFVLTVPEASGESSRPPNSAIWLADQCSKRITGCQSRYDPASSGKVLPIGTFPGTSRVPDIAN